MNNLGSGMEGTVTFMKAVSPDGTVILDRVVDGDADVQALPPGQVVLSQYWRDCGGNCDFLGYAREVCRVEAFLVAGGRYFLSFQIPSAEDPGGDCSLNQP